jgi:hypothetical protein
MVETGLESVIVRFQRAYTKRPSARKLGPHAPRLLLLSLVKDSNQLTGGSWLKDCEESRDDS